MTDQPAPLRLKLPYATEDEFLAKLGPSLARGAMFVATKTPKPDGAVFSFEFVLADGKRVFAGEGKVTAVSRDPSKPGMTLAFRSLDPASQALVAKASAPRQPAPQQPTPVDPVSEERRRRRQAILDGPPPAAPSAGKEPILGIDLGTTICRAAVWLDGDVKLLPLDGRNTALASVVAFDDKGRLLVGARAKAHILVDPKSAVFGAKRLIGRRASSKKVREVATHFPYEVVADEHGDVAVKVQGKVLSIPQITSYLLAEIRNRASDALGCEAKRVVIGVPAYFNDRQRQAVRYAGQLAGLEVIRVLSEPTAVAIAFGFGKGLTRKRLLVYDLGGGTFDASILEATGDDFEVVAAGGDNFLGGLDFDARLAAFLEERFQHIQQIPLPSDPLTRQRVRDAAETAKITLSERAETRVHLAFVGTRFGTPVDLDVPVDRARFEVLTRDLVERTLTVVKAVFEAPQPQIPPNAIDEVLLVGGQSQSPSVREAIEGMVGRAARHDVDPHASVAIGAALVGRALLTEANQTGTFTLSYEEMLSSAIGVAYNGSFDRVLDRGTRLPCEKSSSFKADAAGIKLSIYQGDSKVPAENEFLGKLILDVPPGTAVEVAFAVSGDGVLSVSAVSADGARRALKLATADTSDEGRAALAAASAPAQSPSPAPGPTAPTAPPPDEKKGLFKRLFGRK